MREGQGEPDARGQKEVHRARVVVWQDGLLLVVADARLAPGDRYWSLPGGHVEPGETPEACAAREFAEELGLRLDLGPLWYVGENTYQGRKRLIHETVSYYAGSLDERLPAGPVPTLEARLLAQLADVTTLRALPCLPPGIFARLFADGPDGPGGVVHVIE